MSEIRATTISDLAGTGPATLTGQSASKSFGLANMSGTAAIRASFNVSSLTDAGTGQARFNMTSAMSSSEYIVVAGTVGYFYQTYNISASQYQAAAVNSTGSFADYTHQAAAAHGDLA